MTAALIALAILAQPEALCSKRVAQRLGRVSVQVEQEFKLPSGLLAAVVLAETKGLNRIRRRGNACDCGYAQVRCRPCTAKCKKRLMSMRGNLRAAARKLAISRKVCGERPRAPGCKQCIWGRYNAGSRRWCPTVMDFWKRLKAYQGA